MVNLGKYN